MIRHLTYFLVAFLAVVSFGCSSDDVGPASDIEMTIKLTMEHKMNTRSPRPLEGVDYWQHVTAVRVYVFRADKVDGDYTLFQPEYTDDNGEKKKLEYIDVKAFNKTAIYKDKDFEQHMVVVKPKLPDGYYRLLAIGVDEDLSTFEAVKAGSNWDEIFKSVKNDNPITEEFFSGYSETVHVSSSIDRNFISIELKRCVAGVLLYVKNIPSEYDGKTVDNIKLILSGHCPTTDIVNRTWTTDSVESEIVLVDLNKEGKEEEIDGEKMTYAGKFLVPCRTSKMTNPTMRLVFYNRNTDETETAIGSKNVRLISASDNDYQTPDLDRYGTHYNIIADHVYCIGFRSETGKKYEPIDLSEKSENVDIIAYGSWQADVNIEL